VLVTNQTGWIIAAFAAAKIGAIVTAISTFSTPRELAWMLEHSGAVAQVTIDSFRRRRFLGALRSLCPELDGAVPGALSSAAASLAYCRRAGRALGAPHRWPIASARTDYSCFRCKAITDPFRRVPGASAG
jgi:acyl-coenzyme A synthetase/AMP-(fatty) acid ligase